MPVERSARIANTAEATIVTTIAATSATKWS